MMQSSQTTLQTEGAQRMTRHFLRDDDLTPAEQHEVLHLAASLKQAPYDSHSLAGPRTVATIYDKPTLRTQASFAAGIAELGGHPMMVDGSLAGIGKRESVADVARVLGRQASRDRVAHLRAGRARRDGRARRGAGRSTRSPTSSTPASCWPTCSRSGSARVSSPG